MDTTFVQWALGQAGVGGIAALSLYLLNKTHHDSRIREKEYAETLRNDRQELIRVLNDTTRALAGLQNAINNLSVGKEK